MMNFLTQEQRRVFSELDRIVDFGAAPKRTYLKTTNFKTFQQIMNKKIKHPEAVDDVDLIGDKYRGMQICPWPPK